jgi:hypothetical protein
MIGKQYLLPALAFGLLSMICLTVKAPAGFAATITVNSLADPGAKGICALRDAITAANTHKAVHNCKAGTGNDLIAFSVTGTVMLDSTLPKVTDKLLTINARHSTIDGRGKVRAIVVSSSAKLTLEDMTITGGYSGVGGAIRNAGTLTIANCDLNDNHASLCVGNDCGEGGAILNRGTLTLTSASIEGGQAGNGGAVYNSGKLTMIDSNLSYNTVNGTGGGLYSTGSTIISGSTIEDNSSVCGDNCGDAGGIYSSGPMNITRTTIFGNSSSLDNGGIDTEAGLTVTKSAITNNAAGADYTGSAMPQGGGIGIGNNGSLIIINSTVASNVAGSTSNTLYGPGCGYGGGINGGEGNVYLVNDTIANNLGGCASGEGAGGTGIAAFDAYLKGTILANNQWGDCTSSTRNDDGGYNIINDDDDADCIFYITSNPGTEVTNAMLDPNGLQNNGGPTQTIALEPGSPAIDYIPVTACTGLNGAQITTDQRGDPRPGAGETQCSVGAYEYQD